MDKVRREVFLFKQIIEGSFDQGPVDLPVAAPLVEAQNIASVGAFDSVLSERTRSAQLIDEQTDEVQD
jgi:hypothetical protein